VDIDSRKDIPIQKKMLHKKCSSEGADLSGCDIVTLGAHLLRFRSIVVPSSSESSSPRRIFGLFNPEDYGIMMLRNFGK
jgi:hypothetical protein